MEQSLVGWHEGLVSMVLLLTELSLNLSICAILEKLSLPVLRLVNKGNNKGDV